MDDCLLDWYIVIFVINITYISQIPLIHLSRISSKSAFFEAALIIEKFIVDILSHHYFLSFSFVAVFFTDFFLHYLFIFCFINFFMSSLWLIGFFSIFFFYFILKIIMNLILLFLSIFVDRNLIIHNNLLINI